MQSGRFQRNENVNSNTKMECIQWARVPHCTLLWALHNSTAATAVPSWILLHCVGYYTAHSALCYCLLQHIVLSHRFVTHTVHRHVSQTSKYLTHQINSTQLNSRKVSTHYSTDTKGYTAESLGFTQLTDVLELASVFVWEGSGMSITNLNADSAFSMHFCTGSRTVSRWPSTDAMSASLLCHLPVAWSNHILQVMCKLLVLLILVLIQIRRLGWRWEHLQIEGSCRDHNRIAEITFSLISEIMLQSLSVSAQDEDESDRFLRARLGGHYICHCSTSGWRYLDACEWQ